MRTGSAYRAAAIAAVGVLLLWLWPGGAAPGADDGAKPAVSGHLVDGVREVEVAVGAQDQRLTLYRGDYVRFRSAGPDPQPPISIPALSIQWQPTPGGPPYVKMETAGEFAFSMGAAGGTIAVVDYREAAYREVTPAEAAALIRAVDPLILDVRTPGEVARGRIPGSVLLPLQQLQARWEELSAHAQRPVLIYCATGNRSTVAAKILIDRGFQRVYNLRPGISGWEREQMPVER
jgi:rhodanese-related sulfurtransferase